MAQARGAGLRTDVAVRVSRWGRGARIVAAMLAVGLVLGLVGLPFYVFPARDAPRDVDAVYVIGPPTDLRMELAEQVIADGHTDTLLISIPDDDGDPEARFRHTYERAAALCDGEAALDAEVLCFQPEPFTTRGEAQYLETLIEDRGWDSASVITFTPHITRTRVIMERCVDADLSYLDPRRTIAPWEWVYHFGYQTAGFVKVLAEGPC